MVRQSRNTLHRGRLARPLLLLAGLLASAGAVAAGSGCLALTEEDGLQPLPGCRFVYGRLQLEPTALATLRYDTHGLAPVHAGGGYHYVKPDGRQLPVITFDNGPDYLAEGLLRGRVGTRIGYFDTQFRQAFPATFDFGWAFDEGVARVCNGCTRGTPDAHGHAAMVGGTWHRIDRNGRPAYALDPP